MEFLKECSLKKQLKKQNTKRYTNKTFYDVKNFKKVLKLAFKCKNQKTIDIILKNWKACIKEEVKWGKETKMIDKTEERQVNSLHPKELIMLINIGKIMQETFQIRSEEAFILSFGLIHAYFIFEDTSMNLTLEDMYNTLPCKLKTKSGEKKFKKDFFLRGTSPEIRKILFENNKDG